MDINSKLKLNNGIEIPILGLGVYQSQPGSETYNAVRLALDAGYRHIDTAALYGNEADVGRAVRESKVNREEIFITTKVWNADHGFSRTMKAFDISMKKLNTGYLDLYLVHWPVSNLRTDTWKALEKIYSGGLVRAIGVSNYTSRHLDELLSHCDIMPAVNQVEFSPYLYQKKLLEYCSSAGIIMEAYSPLTRGKKLNDLQLMSIAGKYGKSTAQILIRWSLQHGLVCLPKSVKKDRIINNASVFDFEISDEDMNNLDSLNSGYRVAWDPSDIP